MLSFRLKKKVTCKKHSIFVNTESNKKETKHNLENTWNRFCSLKNYRSETNLRNIFRYNP